MSVVTWKNPSQERVWILDSSAMIAYLNGEIGDEIVTEILADAANQVFAHSVNLIEVRYDFGPPSIEFNARDAASGLEQLREAGVQERRDMDDEFNADVALLIAERRAMPRSANRPRQNPRLALGDAFGIALARRENGVFVTADSTEIEPMTHAGFCDALFIR